MRTRNYIGFAMILGSLRIKSTKVKAAIVTTVLVAAGVSGVLLYDSTIPRSSLFKFSKIDADLDWNTGLLSIHRWDGQFTLRYLSNPLSSGDIPSGKRLTYSAFTVKAYNIIIDDEPGIEYELTLNSKPSTNVLSFQTNMQNFVAHYQPPLNEELNVSQYSFINATHAFDLNGDWCEYRPENVVGSYAVYHVSKINNQYKSGKVFHIYRPQLFDAQNKTVWGKLKVTGNSLTITIPQEFLDTATYPIIVDPSFGYTTAASASTSTAGNVMVLNNYNTTAPESGKIDSITMRCALKTGYTPSFKGVAVPNATKLIIHVSATNTTHCVGAAVLMGSVGWKTSTFTDKPTVIAGTLYNLCAVNDDYYWSYSDTGTTGDGYSDTSNSYTTPTDPTDATSTNRILGIYCNYTASPVPTNSAVAVSWDDTNNAYAQKRYYDINATYTYSTGFAEFDYVECAIRQGDSVRARWRYDEDDDATTIVTGTVFDLNTTTSLFTETGNTIVAVWRFMPRWNFTEEAALDIELYCMTVDVTTDNDTTSNNFDIVTRLVTTGLVTNDARADIGGSVTISGNIYYGNNVASDTATTFYPPDVEFTSVIIHDVAHATLATNTTVVSGAFSATGAISTTVGTNTYHVAINLTDIATPADTLDADTIAVKGDRIEIYDKDDPLIPGLVPEYVEVPQSPLTFMFPMMFLLPTALVLRKKKLLSISIICLLSFGIAVNFLSVMPLVRAYTTFYYLRSALPVHGQPNGTTMDVGTLSTVAPVQGEGRSCTHWVMYWFDLAGVPLKDWNITKITFHIYWSAYLDAEVKFGYACNGTYVQTNHLPFDDDTVIGVGAGEENYQLYTDSWNIDLKPPNVADSYYFMVGFEVENTYPADHDGMPHISSSPDLLSYITLTYTDEWIAPEYGAVGTTSTVAGSSITLYSFWTENVGLSMSLFGWNSSGLWQNETAWIDEWSGTPTSGTTNRTKTSNSTVGIRIEYAFWTNDTCNNINNTGLAAGIHFFITTDITTPVYTGYTSNTTVISRPLGLTITWTDNEDNLDDCIFSTNNTGPWVNTTLWSNAGTDVKTADTSFILNGTVVNVGTRWYCNDTSGNMGDTGILYITTTGTKSIRVSSNTNVIIWFKARYDFDNEPFNNTCGTLSFNGTAATYDIAEGYWKLTVSQAVVGSYLYNVSGVTDSNFGLTVVYSSTGNVSIIWDELAFLSGTLETTDDNINKGTSGTWYANLKYEYDDVEVTDGILVMGGYSMAWDAGDSRWEYSYTRNAVGTETRTITSASGNMYGITVVNATITTDSETIIYDNILVNFDANGSVFDTKKAAGFTVVLTREYNGSAITDYSYTIERNATAYQNPHTTSTFTDMQTEPMVYYYNLTGVTDNTAGITSYTDPNDVVVTWIYRTTLASGWNSDVEFAIEVDKTLGEVGTSLDTDSIAWIVILVDYNNGTQWGLITGTTYNSDKIVIVDAELWVYCQYDGVWYHTY